MYPVKYKAKIYDETDTREDVVYGITFAENYSQAMENIECYYGDTIIEISLYMLEDTSVYEFNETDNIKKNDNEIYNITQDHFFR